MKTSSKAAVKVAATQVTPAAAGKKAAPSKALASASQTTGGKARVDAAPAPSVMPAKKAVTASKAAPVKTKAVAPAGQKPAVAATQPPAAPKAKTAPASSAKKAAAAPEAKPMSVQKVASAAPAAAPAATPSSPDQLVRATRPSARLAQITVPSLPPAVASTAAKASFLPSAPAPVSPSYIPVKKDPKLANNWKTKPVSELIDAEVLAMSDADYMNDAQMAFFRLKLSKLKQDILNSAGETTEHLREDTVVVPDPADRATIEEEHALELRTRDRERKLLKKIEQSIVRIDAGDYGFCDETGEAIGVGRLLARPTATLSLEAQQRRELKQKMFGD